MEKRASFLSETNKRQLHRYLNIYLINTKRRIAKHLLISQMNLLLAIIHCTVRGGLQARIPSIRVFLLPFVKPPPPTAINTTAGTAASSYIKVGDRLLVVRPGLAPGPRCWGRGRRGGGGGGGGGGSSCCLLRLVAKKQATFRVLTASNPLAGGDRRWSRWWRGVALLGDEGKREGAFVRGAAACGWRHGWLRLPVGLCKGKGKGKGRHEHR